MPADDRPELHGPPAEGLSILVVAGEASGDLHASQLCRQIVQQSRLPVQFWGSGGDRMAQLGARLLASAHQLAAIGPAAAIGQLHRYYRLYRAILKEAKGRRPDLAILVDFPDFNLPLARALKRRGIGPLVYFISPQLWAWRQGRVRQVRRTIDQMIVLFPFEADFYRDRGVQARYFGHPLAAREFPVKNRERFARRHNLNAGDVFVAVLPGSRRPEVQSILPVVLEAFELLDEADREKLRLVIAPAPGMEGEVDALVCGSAARSRIQIISDSSEVLAQCDYGLVKSGTSTLEAALAGLPFCVVYRGSPLSWVLVRHLLRTKDVALPNLVLRERVVPELIQNEATPRAVSEMLSSFVRKDKKWETVRGKLKQVRERLHGADPYRDAAGAIVALLGSRA